MSHIRRLSVHIDEPEPGHFYWVLMEDGDDTSEWRELDSADEGYDEDAAPAGIPSGE